MRSTRTISMVKGGVAALLYEQVLSLDLVVPESTATAAGILTLSGTDIDTVGALVAQIHDLWACAVEIAIGDYLLYRQLGAACAVPIALGSGKTDLPNLWHCGHKSIGYESGLLTLRIRLHSPAAYLHVDRCANRHRRGAVDSSIPRSCDNHERSLTKHQIIEDLVLT
jgi:hypothetical protein